MGSPSCSQYGFSLKASLEDAETLCRERPSLHQFWVAIVSGKAFRGGGPHPFSSRRRKREGEEGLLGRQRVVRFLVNSNLNTEKKQIKPGFLSAEEARSFWRVSRAGKTPKAWLCLLRCSLWASAGRFSATVQGQQGKGPPQGCLSLGRLAREREIF